MMNFIDHKKIEDQLNQPIKNDASHIGEVLAKAREMKGLNSSDVLALLNITDQKLLEDLFNTASWVKNEIYGKRLVLFAPLYISNLCNNECLYCAFRGNNSQLIRKALKQEEIAKETEVLVNQGHKRVLLVAGEAYGKYGLDYVIDSIETVYSVTKNKNSIRRINVNIAPLSVEEFKRLHQCNIGTYQIFQETYHQPTYQKLHLRGPKADYEYRLGAMDRAFEGGFDDVGVGILFGLYDWKFEILAMLDHIKHLEDKFGVGPHTISVPRLEPALGSGMSYDPPYPVNDLDFKKILSVLRLAVPYTGLILSTRESREIRRDAFELGISQISAGSKTNPGGYGLSQDEKSEGSESQFSLGDERPMNEVIKDIVSSGFIPSFCTGCYRRGRVGADFMDLAKPGLIKEHCVPNAIFSFGEYLYDFADPELKEIGFKLIQQMTNDSKQKETIHKFLDQIQQGKRDIYL